MQKSYAEVMVVNSNGCAGIFAKTAIKTGEEMLSDYDTAQLMP